MNTAMKLGIIAALSLEALVSGSIIAHGQITAIQAPSSDTLLARVSAGSPQTFWSTTGDHAVITLPGNVLELSAGSGLLTSRPQNALYHQVVDIYYDSDGNKLETKSMTHAINEYCQNGVRRQEDLVAQDDGHGNVRFASVRLPGEPATGVKPVTAEGRIKAMMAIKASPEQPAIATDASPQLAAR